MPGRPTSALKIKSLQPSVLVSLSACRVSPGRAVRPAGRPRAGSGEPGGVSGLRGTRRVLLGVTMGCRRARTGRGRVDLALGGWTGSLQGGQRTGARVGSPGPEGAPWGARTGARAAGQDGVPGPGTTRCPIGSCRRTHGQRTGQLPRGMLGGDTGLPGIRTPPCPVLRGAPGPGVTGVTGGSRRPAACPVPSGPPCSSRSSESPPRGPGPARPLHVHGAHWVSSAHVRSPQDHSWAPRSWTRPRFILSIGVAELRIPFPRQIRGL